MTSRIAGTKLNVLVACEFSGIVTKAFNDKGHHAISIDLLPTEGNVNTHLVQDILEFLEETDGNWDLMIAHPPCTYTSLSGNRWYAGTEKRKEGFNFFMRFINTHIDKIAVEHPMSIINTWYQPPDQYIQPYEYGDPMDKKTGLWLKNLPPLEPTNIIEPPPRIKFKSGKSMASWYSKGWSMTRKERMKYRSRFSLGIAQAMAEQWGNVI